MGGRPLFLSNIAARPFRSAGMMAVAAALSFALLSGSVLVMSLNNGAESVEKRLGADLMVVPRGSGYQAEDILIKGEPGAFYMDASVEESLRGVRGVSAISSQFFLATVSDAECCEFPVQLISFDEGTDFTVSPWMRESYGGSVGFGELVVGSEISVSGGKVRLFGSDHPVAARLSASGTGLDTAIFMTSETMRAVAAEAGQRGYLLAAAGGMDSQVSAVLIKAEPGYDPRFIAEDIAMSGLQVDVVMSKSVAAGLAMQMGALIGYIGVFEAMLWILALVVLGALFSVSVNERKREFAVLRMIGASRGGLARLVLSESLAIGLSGAIIGAILAAAFVLPFSGGIGDATGLPYVSPPAARVLEAFALSVLAAAAAGPLTAVWSARRIGRSETHAAFAEGN
ncbi:MAG: ABC transporter permease [Candidatus Methanoplasma sp.]|jgi:putative ABC transport system permease protein|nr:ABC transporter permease [Candidatus Methanoplasma sp.]